MSDLENQDVFSEETEAPGTSKEVGESDAQEAKAEGEAQSGAEDEAQQGDESAEPPAANKDNKVSGKDKMIPEHRMKAAIKDVTDKYERRLAELTAKPAPDRETDPDGYDRHQRIEISKAIMTETHTDYDDMIEHFQQMAEANPALNQIVGDSKMPAKMAYDLAKRDKEIQELSALKDDPELKEFKEWKKSKAAASTDTAAQLAEKPKSAASKVPNLNRNATAVNAGKATKGETDEDLFAGHHSVRA